MKQTKEDTTNKKLNEKELKKVNGGTEGFELPPREYPEIDGRLIIKTDPEGGNRPGKGEGREIRHKMVQGHESV